MKTERVKMARKKKHNLTNRKSLECCLMCEKRRESLALGVLGDYYFFSANKRIRVCHSMKKANKMKIYKKREHKQSKTNIHQNEAREKEGKRDRKM